MNFKRFPSPRVLKRQTAGGGLRGRGSKFTSRTTPRLGPPLFPAAADFASRAAAGPWALPGVPCAGAAPPPRPRQRAATSPRPRPDGTHRTGRTARTTVPGPAHVTALAPRPEWDPRICTNAVRRPALRGESPGSANHAPGRRSSHPSAESGFLFLFPSPASRPWPCPPVCGQALARRGEGSGRRGQGLLGEPTRGPGLRRWSAGQRRVVSKPAWAELPPPPPLAPLRLFRSLEIKQRPPPPACPGPSPSLFSTLGWFL